MKKTTATKIAGRLCHAARCHWTMAETYEVAETTGLRILP